MTLTINQVFAADGALQWLAQQTFPATTALKVSRLRTALAADVKLAHEQRIAIAQKHGKENKDSGQFEFETPAKRQAFTEELEALLGTTITLHIDKLPFQAIEALEIQPTVLEGLVPVLFIEEAAAAKPEIVGKKKKVG